MTPAGPEYRLMLIALRTKLLLLNQSGITGQLTGSRADLMILDDIEVPGNSMTELMREKNSSTLLLKQNLSSLLKMIPVFFSWNSTNHLHHISQTRRA